LAGFVNIYIFVAIMVKNLNPSRSTRFKCCLGHQFSLLYMYLHINIQHSCTDINVYNWFTYFWDFLFFCPTDSFSKC